MLRSQGYQQLVLVDDPREVLAQYRHWRPDLVLLDINMPHLDGYQVLEQLTALGDPLLPPVVILTAQHSKDVLLRALSLGAREFITKPFDRTELLMRVRNLLDARLAHCLLHQQKEHLEQLVQARTRELYDTRLQVVQRLGKAAEYRDEETGNHILRMSHICTLLARAAGWSEAQCDLILNASPLHDVGKIGIPDAVLLKPGRFDAQEWAVMQRHTHIGAQLLAGDDSELMQMARTIAITHHEQWDGSGYPYGLAGAEIPMAGRIAALADVFDALTSVRPYKSAWPVADALQWLDDNRGKHFDPALVDIFFANLEEILAIRQRFAEPAPG
jgi:putative two-component system response regulator